MKNIKILKIDEIWVNFNDNENFEKLHFIDFTSDEMKIVILMR